MATTEMNCLAGGGGGIDYSNIKFTETQQGSGSGFVDTGISATGISNVVVMVTDSSYITEQRYSVFSVSGNSTSLLYSTMWNDTELEIKVENGTIWLKMTWTSNSRKHTIMAY